MKSVTVDLKERAYTIYVQTGLLDKAGSLMPAAKRGLIISDDTVAPLYADRVRYSLNKAGCEAELFAIPSGEEHKNRDTLEAIYDCMFTHGLDRSSIVIALGGGVVGDVAGFAAATFMRGIRYVQIPTTLLACVDSSVGGKTGINHRYGKNMIGAFYQPSTVIIDPAVLRTLPQREVGTGLAEVIKYGVIRDACLFESLEKNAEAVMNLESDLIEQIIARCCHIKADVVTEDEREGGLRAILNYGHTLGHAIEAITNYKTYRHGEAVAMGMHLVAKLARKMGFVDDGFVTRQAALIKRFNLPTDFMTDSPDKLIELTHADKKAREGRVRYVMPSEIGAVFLCDEVTDDMVRELF